MQPLHVVTHVVLPREGAAAHGAGERLLSLVHAALVARPVRGLSERDPAVTARQTATCETGRSRQHAAASSPIGTGGAGRQ